MMGQQQTCHNKPAQLHLGQATIDTTVKFGKDIVTDAEIQAHRTQVHYYLTELKLKLDNVNQSFE